MSIKKERELFLYELNGHGYEFKNKAWDDHLGRFKDDQLNMVWEMWLASRNRDGFVLVPKEPTKEMMMAVIEEVKNTGHLVCFYKAMIGAADES